MITNKNTSKYYNLIKHNKISIPLPNLNKLKSVIKKDINKLDKKIEVLQSKIDLKNIKNVERIKSYIGQAADFAIIKKKLEKIIRDYPVIVKEIKRIWTNPKNTNTEDVDRIYEPFYSIEFENGWQDFDEVSSDGAFKCDVFNFVHKTMYNTLEYLGKFGCLICVAGSDCEVIETNSCHPWLKTLK